MKRINVITVHHHWALREIASSISDTLKLYDFDVYQTDDFLEQSDFNVIVSGQNIPVSKNNINIVVETDHIEMPQQILYPRDYFAYTRSLHWCDYKKDLTDKNIYYCPIGYSKHFDTKIKRRDLRDTFHMGRSDYKGTLAECRDEFRKRHNLFSVNCAGGPHVIGDKRDELIVTSKVNINTGFYKNYWFAPMHASLILCKGKLLLQEDHGKDDYNWYKPYLILFTESNFREKLDYWISHDKERKEFEHFIYEDIKKNHKYEDIFYNVIKDLLENYR